MPNDYTSMCVWRWFKTRSETITQKWNNDFSRDFSPKLWKIVFLREINVKSKGSIKNTNNTFRYFFKHFYIFQRFKVWTFYLQYTTLTWINQLKLKLVTVIPNTRFLTVSYSNFKNSWMILLNMERTKFQNVETFSNAKW